MLTITEAFVQQFHDNVGWIVLYQTSEPDEVDYWEAVLRSMRWYYYRARRGYR